MDEAVDDVVWFVDEFDREEASKFRAASVGALDDRIHPIGAFVRVERSPRFRAVGALEGVTECVLFDRDAVTDFKDGSVESRERLVAATRVATRQGAARILFMWGLIRGEAE